MGDEHCIQIFGLLADFGNLRVNSRTLKPASIRMRVFGNGEEG